MPNSKGIRQNASGITGNDSTIGKEEILLVAVKRELYEILKERLPCFQLMHLLSSGNCVVEINGPPKSFVFGAKKIDSLRSMPSSTVLTAGSFVGLRFRCS
jgi:hypothetical protein